MELCCHSAALFRLRPRQRLFAARRFPSSYHGNYLRSVSSQGCDSRWLRAMASEETSTVVSEKFGAEANEEEAKRVKEVSYEKPGSVEEGSGSDEGQASEGIDLLSKLDLKLESIDTYSIAIYGTGVLLTVWISSGIIRALDSVPLFPKIMEVVGLGFTVWFSYRYLIFKKSREELLAKIEDLKGQIMGSADD